MLGIEELLGRKPAQLSGGQRQRVAMGRALVREPRAFLLDEPLSNLDAKLRVQVRAELKQLHRRLGITTIYVTHDQVEAMTLGDRIVVMSGGELQQVGAPQDVYDRPANIFVAGFIGSPPMNLLRGTAAGGRITAGDLTFERAGVPDGEVALGIRPEHFAPSADGLPTHRPPGGRGRAARRRGHRLWIRGRPGRVGRDERRGGAPAPAPGVARGDHGPGWGRMSVRGSASRSPSASTRKTVHIFDARTGVAIR